MKLIMENWRKFQKVDESMEKIQALGTKYSDIDGNRLDVLASIARSVAMASFQPESQTSDEVDAYEALDGKEKEYVDAILAINRQAFGDRMGALAPSPDPAQDKEEVEGVDSAMPYTGPDSIKEEIATLDRVYDQIRTATQAAPEDENAMKGLWHLEQAIDLLSRWGLI